MESTTMKKQAYKTPEIEVVNFKMTQNLMTTSNVGFGDSVSDASDAEGHFTDEDW